MLTVYFTIPIKSSVILVWLCRLCLSWLYPVLSRVLAQISYNLNGSLKVSKFILTLKSLHKGQVKPLNFVTPLILLSTTLGRLKMTSNQSKSSLISKLAGKNTLIFNHKLPLMQKLVWMVPKTKHLLLLAKWMKNLRNGCHWLGIEIG